MEIDVLRVKIKNQQWIVEYSPSEIEDKSTKYDFEMQVLNTLNTFIQTEIDRIVREHNKSPDEIISKLGLLGSKTNYVKSFKGKEVEKIADQEKALVYFYGQQKTEGNIKPFKYVLSSDKNGFTAYPEPFNNGVSLAAMLEVISYIPMIHKNMVKLAAKDFKVEEQAVIEATQEILDRNNPQVHSKSFNPSDFKHDNPTTQDAIDDILKGLED